MTTFDSDVAEMSLATLDTDEFQLRGLRVPVYFETKLNRLTDTFHERIE